MFDTFITIAEIAGAAIFRLLPKSFRRKVDPDSTLGQAMGLLIGVSVLVAVMFAVYRVLE